MTAEEIAAITHGHNVKLKAKLDAALARVQELTKDNGDLRMAMRGHTPPTDESLRARVQELETALQEAHDCLASYDGDPDKGSYAITGAIDTLSAALAKVKT